MIKFPYNLPKISLYLFPSSKNILFSSLKKWEFYINARGHVTRFHKAILYFFQTITHKHPHIHTHTPSHRRTPSNARTHITHPHSPCFYGLSFHMACSWRKFANNVWQNSPAASLRRLPIFFTTRLTPLSPHDWLCVLSKHTRLMLLCASWLEYCHNVPLVDGSKVNHNRFKTTTIVFFLGVGWGKGGGVRERERE